MPKKKIRRHARKSEYLLDTSVLRSLTYQEIEQLRKRKSIASFTASYIVPLEILAGTLPEGADKSDEQNKLRKAGLNKYYHLIGLDGTEWEDEDIIIAKAFGVSQQGRDKVPIALLIKACVSSKTLDELESRSASAANLLKEIRQADADTLNSFRNNLEILKKGNPQYPAYDEAPIIKMFIFVLFSELAGVFPYPPTPIAETTYEQLKALEQERRATYDESLDLLIDIWTEYWKELRTLVRPIGKKIYNDVFDLKHVLYLRKDATNQFFVTEDQNLYRLLKKVAPDRVLNKAEFLKQVLG